jgi:hypothetical protein
MGKDIKITSLYGRLGIHERLKLIELAYSKTEVDCFSFQGYDSRIQLCYHEGASKSGSKYSSLALQRITGMQSTDAASKKQMLNNLCDQRVGISTTSRYSGASSGKPSIWRA